jgi:hypothetical protein
MQILIVLFEALRENVVDVVLMRESAGGREDFSLEGTEKPAEELCRLLFCSIKKALPTNRLVNFPLSRGSSRDYYASVVLLRITCEAWCYPFPAFASASGPLALPSVRPLRSGSLATQLAARLPVPVFRSERCLIPLVTGQHLTPTGVGSATPLSFLFLVKDPCFF